MALLELVDVTKSFGDTPVLRGVSFGVERGEIVCLLGLSLIHISEPTRPY